MKQPFFPSPPTEVGICNMFGDPHTQRFDGQWLHYMGNPGCRYVVTTNACQLGSKEDFRVLMKPWRQQPPQQGYEGATWLQNIEVHIKGRVGAAGWKIIVSQLVS